MSKWTKAARPSRHRDRRNVSDLSLQPDFHTLPLSKSRPSWRASLNMFRSIGVITVALTLALAALADGEPAIPGLISSLSGHKDAVYSIAFAGDGRQVVTGSF